MLIKFLFKYKIPIVVTLLIIAIAASWVIVSSRQQSLTPTPSPVNVWGGITPGISTLEELNDSLGEPVNITGNKYEYGSKNPNINNEAVVDNNTVLLLKRITVIEEQLSINDLLSKYGTGYITLYGQRSQAGDNLYVYLSKGVAFLGNPIDDSVSEIWYFVPRPSIESFITEYAQDYSLTLNSEQIQF